MPLGDRDFNRINDNLRKMFKGGATEQEIDSYVSDEGVTADEIKAFNTQQNFDNMMQPNAVTTVSPDGTAQTQTKQQFEQAQKPMTGAETSEARAEAVVKGIPLIGGLIPPAIQAGLGEAFELFGKAEPATFKERFLQARKEFKARQEKLRSETPKTALALELAGGIPASIGAMGLIGKAGKALAPAVKGIKKVPALAKLLTSAAETAPVRFAGTSVGKTLGAGAGFGGAFEAGQVLAEKGAEEKKLPTVGEVLKGAAKGTAIGAATAGFLGGGVGIAKGLLGTLSRASKPSKFLIKKLGEDIIRDAQKKGISLLETGTGLRAGQKVLQTAKTAAKISEDAAEIIQKSTTEKLKALPQRLSGTLDDLFGTGNVPNTQALAKVKYAPIKQELYGKAFATPLDTTKTESMKKLNTLLQNRTISEDAVKRLKQLQKINPQEFPDISLTDINTKTLDTLKRGLDSIISIEKSKVTALDKEKIRLLNGLRKKFVDTIDDLNPNYKLARKAASDEFGINNAIEAGKEALKETPFEIENKIKDFGKPEMEAFLISIKDGLIEKSQRIATSEKKDIFTALFKASEDFSLRKRLEPILGKQNFIKFNKFLEAEHIKNKTLTDVLKQSERTLLESSKKVVPTETLGFFGAIPRVAGTTIAGKTEIPFQTRIAEYLTDPELLKKINVKEATALQKALKGQTARTSGQLGSALF